MLGLQAMRFNLALRISDIRCYFDWDSDYNFDRTQTINQLTFVTLPQGIQRGNFARESGWRNLSLFG